MNQWSWTGRWLMRYLALACLLGGYVRATETGLRKKNKKSRCEKIESGYVCSKQTSYTSTIFPNAFNDQHQREAKQRLTYYYAILNEEKPCHEDLLSFFCVSYVPVCHESSQQDSVLKPCRHSCEKVHKACKSKMQSYKMAWPAELDCKRLPKFESDECLNLDDMKQKGIRDTYFLDQKGCSKSEIECPADLRLAIDGSSVSVNRYTFLTTRGVPMSHCGAPCGDEELFWSKTDRAIVRIAIAVASALSLLTTAFALATYCTDSTRFRYPEKPIIWLAACYFFISFAYLLGALTANDVSCKQLETMSTTSENQKADSERRTRRIVAQGTDSTDCTLTFMLLYFFTIAVGVWWVILALTWLLAAGWKWSSEAIERISQYFHFAAWGLPTILTLVILSQGKVDGDSLSGVCFTGQLDSAGLYNFVFLPMTVCLALGTFCLIIGFVALFRIRKNFKRSATTTGLYASSNSGPTDGTSSHNQFDQRLSIAKLEALMMKIGMFSIGYVIPAAVVLACIYYETSNYDDWVKSWLIEKGKDARHSTVPNYCALQKLAYADEPKKPSLTIFLVKYMVQLFCGTICGCWVWSMKTLHQWFNIFGCGPALYNTNANNEMLYQRGSNVMSSAHQASHKDMQAAAQTPGYQHSAFPQGPGFREPPTYHTADGRGEFPLMPQHNGQQYG